MSGDGQSLLLTLIGAAIIRIGVDNTFEQYVRSSMRPWLIAAGAVLAAVGLITLARANIHRFRPAASEPDAHTARIGIAWLLLLPVLAIFVVAPGALGAYSASRGDGSIGSAPPDANGFSALPAGDPAPDTLRDFSERAVWDDARTLAGRHVSLTGFVTPGDGNTIYLTRMMITCCAADATPIKIVVTGAIGAEPANAWLTVTGVYAGLDSSRVQPGHDPLPILRAETAQRVKPPTNPYEG